MSLKFNTSELTSNPSFQVKYRQSLDEKLSNTVPARHGRRRSYAAAAVNYPTPPPCNFERRAIFQRKWISYFINNVALDNKLDIRWPIIILLF